MSITSGTAGMKAEPSWRRHAIFPTLYTARLAQNPRKMPKAVHNCQGMTKPPRILAGTFSAAYIGTTEVSQPIPGGVRHRNRATGAFKRSRLIPSRIRVTNSWYHVWEQPLPITEIDRRCQQQRSSHACRNSYSADPRASILAMLMQCVEPH